MPRRPSPPLIERSFLRRADPRTKLVVSAAATAAVMLPLPQLGVFALGYLLVVLAAGLAVPVVGQVRRAAVFLVVVGVVDWYLIGPDFALLMTVRLLLLATAFTAVVATTTPDELHAALERLWVPSRLAFTIAASYRFIAQLEAEWRGILEAQQARGIVLGSFTWRRWRDWSQALASVVPLVVPAVVLATQRAWLTTEAAAVRGFESPRRRRMDHPRLRWIDCGLLVGTLGLLVSLSAYR